MPTSYPTLKFELSNHNFDNYQQMKQQSLLKVSLLMMKRIGVGLCNQEVIAEPRFNLKSTFSWLKQRDYN